jgi:hypothetical protein
MRFDALLHANRALTIERPPRLWEAEADEPRVASLVAAMIGALSARGVRPADLTLNISNVVVETSDDGDDETEPRPGEYVAVTVLGRVDAGADDRWSAARSASGAVLTSLQQPLAAAGVRFAYVRRLPPQGSITVYLPAITPVDGGDI